MLETSLNADIRSGQIGSVCVLILAILLGSLPSAFAADAVACAVPPPQPADALKAIEAISTIDSPALTPTTRIVPAGTSADFAVQKEFDSTTTYRAVIKGSSAVLLYETKIIPRRIPTDHTLVKSGTVAPASTLITLQIRSSLGTWWSEGTVYIFGCKEQSGPVFLSSMTMPISDWFYSGTLVWGFLIVIYVLIAIAAKVVDKSERKMSFWRYLDPVVLTAGATILSGSRNRGERGEFWTKSLCAHSSGSLSRRSITTFFTASSLSPGEPWIGQGPGIIRSWFF